MNVQSDVWLPYPENVPDEEDIYIVTHEKGIGSLLTIYQKLGQTWLSGVRKIRIGFVMMDTCV